MVKPFPFLLFGAVGLLGSCQQTPHHPPAPTTPPFMSALTMVDARAAVAGYLQTQPNASLYVIDSARINDNDATWQVLVPRTDWAKRMPNHARFEVDKATGNVHPAPTK